MNTRYYPANLQWFFVHPRRGEMLSPPLPNVAPLLPGVAPPLRLACRDAMHCVSTVQRRAESLAIDSTGCCPIVGKHHRPCAFRYNMLVENTGRHPSPRPVRDGMWVEKRKWHNISDNTFRPLRDGGRNCAGYFFYQHIVPTAQRRYFFPLLGVASTLRRTCRDAMHCVSTMQRRAESPAINSTGQRPVWKGHSFINKPQRGEIKSNSLISPRKGEISVARRFNAGELSAMKPPAAKPRYILSDNRIRFVSCDVYKKRSGLRRSGVDDTVSYPALKRRATPISPFQGYGYRVPSFTGRCPVLLTTGLSALHCSVETQCIASLHARRSVDATPSRIVLIDKIHGINGRNASAFINSKQNNNWKYNL
jgi:hypothetical protein